MTLLRRGFTLLEVVVALSILSLALMAIFDLNAGAVAMHAYTKKLTVATLLARSKMTDIEQQLYDKGFSTDDEEDGGDFSEEKWPEYKWRVKIIAPKTDGISPEQVIGAVFGVPLGVPGDSTTGGSSTGSQDPLAAIGALLGGAGGGSGSGAGGAAGAAGLLGGLAGGLGGLTGGAGGPGGGGGLLSMLGPMAGPQFQQMVDQLTKSVREIHLTVSWKEGKQVESIDLVTHMVSAGQGGDRNGVTVGGQSAASSGVTQAQGSWVDQITGAPCTSPTPGPNGTMTNPATGNPCVQGNPGAAGAGGLPGAAGMPGATGAAGASQTVPNMNTFRPGFPFLQNPGGLGMPAAPTH
jgi:general secretion pathway protein I